ncbi:TldD/PmbA family protein [Oceanirhabdus seepicola]|uniref:TldD/PmbA family protein n=1 Tax=Oceanirhabdus seepicola TaxID=2828781 RepID=A0A9J6NUM7_9CLOT|nr:TldD/PmbA family protein [Oceanirhabdus seepicola]
MIKNSVRHFKNFFTGYNELRAQTYTKHSMVLVDGNLIRNNKETTTGISSRAFNSGAWGFASAPNMSEESVRRVIKQAEHNAQFLSSKKTRKVGELEHISAENILDLSTGNKKVQDKEKMEFIKELDNYILEKCEGLVNRTLSYVSYATNKELINSEESSYYTYIPITIIFVDLVMEDKEGMPISLYEIFGGTGEYEDNFGSPEELYKKIDELYNCLKDKVEGVYAKSGVKDVILDSSLAGILAHEAIGHTTEADGVMGGSIARDYLGRQCASELVTLVDFAHTAQGKQCPIPLYIDDEGTVAEDVTIIEKGILKGYMHNKESAAYFGVKPKGNGRAFQFNDEPLIRMRNTAIIPGNSRLQDMISSVEDGYYLMTSSNGQADSTSEFMFGVVKGYEIKNGKLGKAIRDTTIAGVAFDVLKSVTMISDDMSWESAGFCGKKQPISVGMGGPAIKCKVNIGGK